MRAKPVYRLAHGFFPADAGVSFSELYHAHDERIPVSGFRWGLHALAEAVARFCG